MALKNFDQGMFRRNYPWKVRSGKPGYILLALSDRELGRPFSPGHIVDCVCAVIQVLQIETDTVRVLDLSSVTDSRIWILVLYGK